jgi:hypothetical protein
MIIKNAHFLFRGYFEKLRCKNTKNPKSQAPNPKKITNYRQHIPKNIQNSTFKTQNS